MALGTCRECGNKVSTEALACPHCGAPQRQATPLAAPVIAVQPASTQQPLSGRTESVVVQVAPDYENQKIQEMQLFGWTLQGRQEIEQQGEAYGRPSYLAEFTGTYVIKTTVHRFVKLHFIRSLTLPNLDKIRHIESEYTSLPFPGPSSLKGPGCFTVFWAIGVIPSLMVMSEGHVGLGLGLLFTYGLFVALGVYWLKSRMKKSAQAAAACKQSAARAAELEAELRTLE